MSSQDTINPLTPLTPPRTLNTYKDRNQQQRQAPRKKSPARKGRQDTNSKHIDEYV
jgi:hypothetical protein